MNLLSKENKRVKKAGLGTALFILNWLSMTCEDGGSKPSWKMVLRQFRCRIFCATFCQSAYWARSAFILGKICFLRTGLAHSLWPSPHCVVDSAGKVCPLKSDFAQKYEWPRPKAPQTLPVVIRLLFPCTESDEEPYLLRVGNLTKTNPLTIKHLQEPSFRP